MNTRRSASHGRFAINILFAPEPIEMNLFKTNVIIIVGNDVVNMLLYSDAIKSYIQVLSAIYKYTIKNIIQKVDLTVLKKLYNSIIAMYCEYFANAWQHLSCRIMRYYLVAREFLSKTIKSSL